MSHQAQTWVVECSQHKGASLLVLLMIANHAHADGTGAYPSINTLARETRLNERQVRRIVKVLEESGELVCAPDAGPRGTTLYSLPYVPCGRRQADILPAPRKQADKMSARDEEADILSAPPPDIFNPLADISDGATGHFDAALPDIFAPLADKMSTKPINPREEPKNRERESGRVRANGHGQPQARAPTHPLMAIPDPWTPDAEDQAFIAENALRRQWLEDHTRVFLEHYQSREDTEPVRNSERGWHAAWRKWISKDLAGERRRAAGGR